MSAFVVDDSTINAVVSFLHMKAMGNSEPHNYGLRQLAEAGFDLRKDEDCERLANDMFRLNIHAVEERYGKGKAADFRPLDFQYRFSLPRPVIPTLKALECWHYQCTEGDAVQRPLYCLMTEVENAFRAAIVDSLPAYQQAKWG